MAGITKTKVVSTEVKNVKIKLVPCDTCKGCIHLDIKVYRTMSDSYRCLKTGENIPFGVGIGKKCPLPDYVDKD